MPTSDPKQGMFVMPNGRSVKFTFILVSSLFLLWGFCNGMIDVMDKHFQKELSLTLAQSANVQFAHYLGYFLMALPAGWLAKRFGWKGGIIGGLLLVAIGGFWFIPATKLQGAAHSGALDSSLIHLREILHLSSPISAASVAFVGYLFGVCMIAGGLTFLETVANPYTTVLGPTRYAAARINLAQSCNGVGWILGPIAGAAFFYSKEPMIWLPYVCTAVLVVILAVIFKYAYVPEVQIEDDYQSGDSSAEEKASPSDIKKWEHVLLGLGFIWTVCRLYQAMTLVGLLEPSQFTISGLMHALGATMIGATAVSVVVNLVVNLLGIGSLAICLAKALKRPDSLVRRPHFALGVSSQFLYVAAQAGIFSFFVNCMTVSAKTHFCMVPPIPETLRTGVLILSRLWARIYVFIECLPIFTKHDFCATPAAAVDSMGKDIMEKFFESGSDGLFHISDMGAATLASVAFICFLLGRVSGAMLLKYLSPNKVLGFYGTANVCVCLLIFFNLGWISVAGVFLSYFFMSIMFPTIFALGIFGLGDKTKSASAFLVMAIVGGALLPKLMGAIADQSNLCRSFIVPMCCFAFIAFYGYMWPKFSGVKSMQGIGATSAH
jgi:FHS family L-fucose permease-like MFS transporter